MFHLFDFVSFLLGGMLGFDLASEASLRSLEGADESDGSGALDPDG